MLMLMCFSRPRSGSLNASQAAAARLVAASASDAESSEGNEVCVLLLLRGLVD
jgi:hypothetical protein